METHNINVLFEPVRSKGLELKNRVVMAPMTRSRAIGNVPNELMATYYGQRASAGLIISEGAAPSPSGLGYSRIPGIYDKAQVAGWKKVTGAVHAKGGKIFLQIMHTGRIAHPDNLPAGVPLLAPSAIKAEGAMWTDTKGMQPFPVPSAMTTEQVEQTVADYAAAAARAVEAGFDGVEIHAANGYLPSQFLNPHSNKRSDGYGGDIAGRSRFVLELAEATAGLIGPQKTGIRFSPYGTFNTMAAYEDTFATYDYLSARLNKLDIAYLHLLEGPARQHEEGRRLIAQVRRNFDNLLILNEGYTAESAAETIGDGRADLISFGVPFIANPDFVEKIKQKTPLAPADPETFYTPGEEGYTSYAAQVA